MHKKQSLICISCLNQRHIYIPTFSIKLTKFSIFPVFLTVERKYCSHNNISSCSHKYLDSLWLTLFSSKKKTYVHLICGQYLEKCKTRCTFTGRYFGDIIFLKMIIEALVPYSCVCRFNTEFQRNQIYGKNEAYMYHTLSIKFRFINFENVKNEFDAGKYIQNL